MAQKANTVGSIESAGLKTGTARCLLPLLVGSLLVQAPSSQQGNPPCSQQFGPGQALTSNADGAYTGLQQRPYRVR